MVCAAPVVARTTDPTNNAGGNVLGDAAVGDELCCCLFDFEVEVRRCRGDSLDDAVVVPPAVAGGRRGTTTPLGVRSGVLVVVGMTTDCRLEAGAVLC